jgi:broad specificity phosphatase PhoE
VNERPSTAESASVRDACNTTTVHLTRHGETEWNRALRWQGHEDIALNELGLAQAAALAQRLAEEALHPDLIASSDLARAFRTAQLAAEALGCSAIEQERGLREIDVGCWSGRTRDEAERLTPGVLARIDAGEDLPRGGGERFADLQRRAGAVFDRLVERCSGGTLLLVLHGGTVRALLAHALGAAGGLDYPQLAIGNTSLTTLEGRPGAWRLLRLDDRAHLAGMEKGPRGAEVEGV